MKILMLLGHNRPMFYRRLCKKISLTTAGAVIQGFAMAVFLFPHDILPVAAQGLRSF